MTPARLPRRLPKLRDTDLTQKPEIYAQNREVRVAALRAALRAALSGSPLNIEIYWMHERTRDQVLIDLSDLLGLTPGSALLTDHDQSWRVARLDVRVRSTPIGSLGTPLDLPAGKRSAAWDQAIRVRREEVIDRLGPTSGDSAVPTLAFVEIGGKASFTPDSDPKYALRLGYARAGRLTQFITDIDDADVSVEIRSRSACLDGFRQLGAVTFPDIVASASVPGDLQQVGLWLIQHNQTGRLPKAARRLVAVRLRPNAEQYPICGWDEDAGDWVPYPHLLLALAQRTEPNTANIDDGPPTDRFQRTIQQTIRTLLFNVRDEPTLLLVNSANLRRAWPWLSNGRLVKDMIRFGDAAIQRLAAYGPYLQLVLVRDHNGREETAQWYALGAGQPGFANGLWKNPGSGREKNRVFFSSMDVSSSFGNHPRGLRKLIVDPRWPAAPAASVLNPQGLEVTVAGYQPGRETPDAGASDNPEEWASVVHQSRFHNDHQHLSRPFAQHLAWCAAEYVLPSHEDSG